MITETEYQNLKRLESVYNSWSEQFRQKDGWTVIPADAIPPVGFGNNDRAKIEEYDFMTKKPAAYTAYYDVGKALITNWTGVTLALVQSASFPRRSNFGDKRIYFTALGVNGIRYHGVAYISGSDLCRMRAFKNQKI